MIAETGKLNVTDSLGQGKVGNIFEVDTHRDAIPRVAKVFSAEPIYPHYADKFFMYQPGSNVWLRWLAQERRLGESFIPTAVRELEAHSILAEGGYKQIARLDHFGIVPQADEKVVFYILRHKINGCEALSTLREAYKDALTEEDDSTQARTLYLDRVVDYLGSVARYADTLALQGRTDADINLRNAIYSEDPPKGAEPGYLFYDFSGVYSLLDYKHIYYRRRIYRSRSIDPSQLFTILDHHDHVNSQSIPGNSISLDDAHSDASAIHLKQLQSLTAKLISGKFLSKTEEMPGTDILVELAVVEFANRFMFSSDDHYPEDLEELLMEEMARDYELYTMPAQNYVERLRHILGLGTGAV